MKKDPSKGAKMELQNRDFALNIAEKYTNLKLFSIHFIPLLSLRRTTPFLRRLGLIYALPFLALRRELLNSVVLTKNVLPAAQQIWDVVLHLEFSPGRYSSLLAGSERQPPAGIQKDLMVTSAHLPVAMPQSPVLSSTSYAISHNHVTGRYPHRISDLIITSLFTYYSQRPLVAVARHGSREPTGKEIEKKWGFMRRTPTGILQPFLASNKKQETSIRSSRNEFGPPSFGYHLWLPLRAPTQSVRSEKSIIRKETEVRSLSTPYSVPWITTQLLPGGHKPLIQRSENLRAYTESNLMFRPFFAQFAQLPLTRRAHPGTSQTVREETAEERGIRDDLPLVAALPSSRDQAPVEGGGINLVRTSFPHLTQDFITSILNHDLPRRPRRIEEDQEGINAQFPYYKFINTRQTSFSERMIEKTPLYHRYPGIEHVTAVQREVITERVAEKEEERSQPPLSTTPAPQIDITRLGDQIYSFIERKLKIERERRGIYG